MTGDELAVLCPVDSCVPNVMVEFRRGRDNGPLLERVLVEDPRDTVVQFNPIVNNTLPGEYHCRVTGTFMGNSFMFVENFNITGMGYGVGLAEGY